jgi:hypothetical protein
MPALCAMALDSEKADRALSAKELAWFKRALAAANGLEHHDEPDHLGRAVKPPKWIRRLGLAGQDPARNLERSPKGQLGLTEPYPLRPVALCA